MELSFINRFSAKITVVANEFIDEYMADANGEYVKVYLYLLRHEGETITLEAVADALNHTEADVRRAIAYWQKAGVLEKSQEPPVQASERNMGSKRDAVSGRDVISGRDAASGRDVVSGRDAVSGRDVVSGRDAVSDRDTVSSRDTVSEMERQSAGAADMPAARLLKNQAVRETSASCVCDLEALSDDETFTQLVYISQKYLNKTFTPVDCQVFVNLYKNLNMPSELIEFLVEYCAQNGHTSLRYVEKVALSWHEKNIMTVEEARAYSRSFSKESFAVMKAMGLTGRNPADSEFELMEKWFRTYGFTKEIVVEACNRTIKTIHNPSFQYADKILSDWKEAGVRTMSDIAALDKIRKEQEQAKTKKSGREADGGTAPARSGPARSGNRFHNLEEHGYDYDEMVWDMINAGQKGE